MEEPHEHIEHAAHSGVGHAKQAAILIAALAAALAICEFGAKNAQIAYLTRQIEASDTWAQYQAKSIRRALYDASADQLETQTNAADPLVQTHIADARANARRMRTEPGADGMEQLADKAREREHERDHELHRSHGLETGSGGLQLAIVLASVSVVTGVRALVFAAGLLGTASIIYAAAAAFSLF
jgi:hypothetical protein